MSEVVGADEAGLEAARRALEAGDAVVFPTDTVYGLGARPDAARRLFEIKGRPRDLTLPVLSAGVADARGVARFDGRAEALAASFWPGGLTIVLPRAASSAGWDLGEQHETVGILSHTTAIKILLADLIPGYNPLDVDLDNTSVTTISRKENVWELVAVDDVSHLENLERRAARELEANRDSGDR